MKHSSENLLPNIKKSAEKNKKTILFLESWSSLPLLVSSLKKPCSIICDEGLFDDVSSSFNLLSSSIAFVPHIDKDESISSSYHQEMFERASALVSYSYNDISLFIVDKTSVKRPLFHSEELEPFVFCGEKTKREDFLAFLEQNRYESTDVVSTPGEYASRGGVLDVFSFSSKYPFRVGFLGGNTKALIFNPNSGDVVREETTVKAFPFPQKPLYSIEEKIKQHKFIILCKKEKIIIENTQTKSVTALTIKDPIKTIRYSDYKKNKDKEIVFCSFLLSSGCKYKNTYYLPSWYVDGKNNISTKKIPLVGRLKHGDYYVHDVFGVCQYTGNIEGSDENKKGFISLRFSDGRITLSVNLLNKLHFYAPGGSNCELGSFSKNKKWLKQRSRAEQAAKDFSQSILSSYIERESSLIPPFKYDEDLFNLFLSEFKYLDTKDQSLAWLKIKEDLSSNLPMHRLLCGDVGFGKTEIAIRAVFYAFINNKKAVVLAPTTILSQQLYSCFSDRLKAFGCNIFQVSRLTKNNKEKFKDFLLGKTDVLIGTHSIIKNQDVLKKASLLVVDEEHRFGVKDKEKIIKISPHCNFLSMSATPIPRTLQFALSGIRNISTLLTAPVERRPIITNVHVFNLKTIANYILKELNRSGQVYFVDNSVDSLKRMFNYFRKELPNIKSSYLYGGMEKNKIKKTMNKFREKSFSVLFSTTIIESGIDVSAANTIIINNAHMFGLSQLHQLRGRVGRSDVQSYAALFIPKNKQITKEGEERLASLKRHSSLGSGYSLSLEDLQIRGSGSLFGYKQSGESTVGFSLYSKILSKTMRNGFYVDSTQDPVIDIDSAFISSSIIKDQDQKVFYYKKISDCLNEESVNLFLEETTILFGALPFEFVMLFKSKKLSFLAEKTPVVGIKKDNFLFTITASSIKIKNISSFLNKSSDFFENKKIKYTVSSNTSFLKIQFSFVDEDYYILLKSYLNLYV